MISKLTYDVLMAHRKQGLRIYPAGRHLGSEYELKELEPPPAGEDRQEHHVFFAHPSTVIDPGCQVGSGTFIWHFCHLMPDAKVGQGCNIGQNCFVDNGAVVGSGCKIQNNVSVYRKVVLGDDVFCGPSSVFTNVKTPRSGIKRGHESYDSTEVSDGATIGANATIICGAKIGKSAMVGAGAVVTGRTRIGAFELWLGTPAQRVGYVCRCGEPLRGETGPLRCSVCGWTLETA